LLGSVLHRKLAREDREGQGLFTNARQRIALAAFGKVDLSGPARLRRRRFPLVSEVLGGYVVLAGQYRVEAARAAGLDALEVIVVDRLAPAFADLARRLVAGEVPPAELAETTEQFVRAHGVRAVAESLGLSAPHVRNLARLRRALAPEAWAAFAAEGTRAALRWWLALAALPAAEQIGRLSRRRAAPRRRSNRLLEQKRRELAPNDVRARVLGWVLGVEDFPRVPGGVFDHTERATLAPNRS
jgi:hypothetical protein